MTPAGAVGGGFKVAGTGAHQQRCEVAVGLCGLVAVVPSGLVRGWRPQCAGEVLLG